MRLDGGAKKFRQRWGYELANQPPVLLEEDEDEDEGDVTDSVSLQETTSSKSAVVAICVPSPLGEFSLITFFRNLFSSTNIADNNGSKILILSH